jgi:hypothetical protein
MNCAKCRKKMERELPRCPHCGMRNPSGSGTFQVSAVLISTSSADRVYRSVDEVPDRLRTRLLKSTNSPNSATILIADRRGRKEIAKAMRKLPGPAHRRLLRSVLSSDAVAQPIAWFTPVRRAAVMAAIALCCFVLIAFAFTRSWGK